MLPRLITSAAESELSLTLKMTLKLPDCPRLAAP